MSSYKLTARYEGSPFPSEFEHLTSDQVEQCLGAFMRDMLGLPGSVVSKVIIERESS
jgi:hypothetical protein